MGTFEMNRIYNGDCFEVMPELIAKGMVFDAVITDIPYAETRAKWDTEFDLQKMWNLLGMLCKKTGAKVLFCNEPYSSKVRLSNLGEYRYDWKWVKNRATGFANANYRPMRKYEDILVFSSANASAGGRGNAMSYHPQGIIEVNRQKMNTEKRKGLIKNNNANVGSSNQLMRNSKYMQKYTNYPDNILEFPCESHYIHPTQKPLPLMEYLVKTYTEEGESVLDFTCGSGTTCVAALLNGRKYVGIESDEDYFRSAEDRLKQIKSNGVQKELF